MSTARLGQGLPPLWSRADVAWSSALIVVGSLIWAVGWFRVAARASLEAQVAPMNVAVAGIVVVGIGQALWFMKGRRRVGDRRRVLLSLAPEWLERSPSRPTSAASAVSESDWYVGNERFFHTPECPMTANRGWHALSRAQHVDAHRLPCGVCSP